MPTTKTPDRSIAMVQGVARSPDDSRPWEDRTLSPTERYESYDRVLREHVEGILTSMTRAGITQAEQTEIRLNPETQHWVSELRLLSNETPEEFCSRINGGWQRELLGKNFLGAEEWKQGFGVDVGVVPPIPSSITKALLESDCPITPGKKIKETHLLVLMPKSVNGKPYTPIELDRLCSAKKDKLIHDGGDWTKMRDRESWPSRSQGASIWMLIPKGEPDPNGPEARHFRNKTMEEQWKVHKDYYPNYLQVQVVELMTAVLLNEVVNKEGLKFEYRRCDDLTRIGASVCVSRAESFGVIISDGYDDQNYKSIGWGLARIMGA